MVALTCLIRSLTLAHVTPCRLPDHPRRAGKPCSISSWSRPLPASRTAVRSSRSVPPSRAPHWQR